MLSSEDIEGASLYESFGDSVLTHGGVDRVIECN